MRVRRWLIVIALLLATGAGSVGGGWIYLRDYLAAPLAVDADGLQLMLPPGTTFSRVSRDLESAGALSQPWILEWYARLTGEAKRIKAGEYLLAPGTTVQGALAQLVAGDIVMHEVTLIEGRTFREALAQLQAHPAIDVVLAGVDDAAIMARLGKPDEHPEGRFFPDTYAFSRGATDFAVLERAYRSMQAKLAAAWATRAQNLPLETPYEALILASIIEKETALNTERARISGVFVRRLKLGMRLQTDPTVIYGMGKNYTGDIRRRDLTTDTPYNTYTRAGLPPTPIALPGEGALRAAVQPEESNALYFVATGEPDGSHFFSATLAEHNKAVQRYLARLRSSP